MLPFPPSSIAYWRIDLLPRNRAAAVRLLHQAASRCRTLAGEKKDYGLQEASGKFKKGVLFVKK
jgi:hypothetical protein